MSELYTALYTVLACGLGWILVGFVRRSEFGILVIYSELFTYVGAFIFPIAYYSGFVEPAVEGSGFLERNSQPGVGTALHVSGYLIGSACGVLLANYTSTEARLLRSYALAATLIGNERRFLRGSLFLGIFFLVMYLTLVGWETAIAQAAAIRGGNLENIGDEEQHFLFLKSLAFCFTFVVGFTPLVLREPSRLLIASYAFFVLILYATSVSRTVVLFSLVVPFFMYLRFASRRFLGFVALSMLVAPALLLFLIYGKPIGFVLFKLVDEGELVSIEPYLFEHGILSAFFGNFEFVWFSVEAGTKHFFTSEGSLLPEDLLLSIAGFIPSRILDQLGMNFLDYRTVTQPLSCLNTSYFGLECTVPPRDLGLSAYVLPVGAAFLLGLAKYFIYRRQELAFAFACIRDYRKTWLSGLTVILFTMFFTFIPTVVSQLAFLVVILGGVFALSLLLRFALSRHPSETLPR